MELSIGFADLSLNPNWSAVGLETLVYTWEERACRGPPETETVTRSANSWSHFAYRLRCKQTEVEDSRKIGNIFI